MKRLSLVLALCASLCGSVQAQVGLPFPISQPQSAGTPTCSFADAQHADNNATTRTFFINIGTAAANRLVVIALAIQGPSLASNIVVAGTTITTPDVSGNNSGSNFLAFYSSLVTTGSGTQTITVNGVIGFAEVGISVWTCTGLSSNTVQPTPEYQSGTPLSINVNAGDFLFAMDATPAAATTFSGSTQLPTAFHAVDAVGPTFNSADWITITSTNASFSVVGTPAQTNSLISARYR